MVLAEPEMIGLLSCAVGWLFGDTDGKPESDAVFFFGRGKIRVMLRIFR